MSDFEDILQDRRRVLASRLAWEFQNFLYRTAHRDDDFNLLARRIFAYQWRFNAPYRAFCDGRGVTPERIETWRDIPAAPAAAYKMFALTCAPEEKCTPKFSGVTFHSSGTTQRETSRHWMDSAAKSAYVSSLAFGYRRFVRPDQLRTPIFALMPPPAEPPHSSLSFMLGALGFTVSGEGWSALERKLQAFQAVASDFASDYPPTVGFFSGEGWQTALALALEMQTVPVTLFGTAFAFVHFFDAIERRFSLPEGSRVVETGGFKGRSREISREELYALFTTRLGVLPTHCLSEYGMSEMASQFYDSTLYDAVHNLRREPRKIGSPSVKTRVIDPVTNQDAAPGQPGLLTHYDLANLNSTLAIQTEDMGKGTEDGEGFHLLGRAPGAILRGCSLTAEEMANAISRGL